MSELLTAKELKRKEALEQVIENGLTSFLEVGTALMEIREHRLYRASHKTFEVYCRERWDMTPQRAGQFISAVHLVNSLETIVSKPDLESQVRPLSQLPEKHRGEAWEEAVRSSPNGKPTAAKVQETVNRRLATINGQYAPDPPDIAKARASGKIPAHTIVEITEPDEPTDLDDIAEEHEEAAAQAGDAISDDDWIGSFPVAAKLDGFMLRTFRKDALAFRALEKARESYLYHARRILTKQHKGEYGQRVMSFLSLDGPAKWLLCPAAKDGGCGGSGRVVKGLECPKCKGRGYWIPR